MSDAIERLAATIHENTDMMDLPEYAALSTQAALAVLRDLHLSPDAAAGLTDGSWVAVPREPSPEMLTASRRYWRGTKHPRGPGLYRAMIAAAAQQNGEK